MQTFELKSKDSLVTKPPNISQAGLVQAKATIPEPQDRLEREADLTADHIVHMQQNAIPASNGDPGISRVSAGREGQRFLPSGVTKTLNSPGRSLETGTRLFMESQFNRDFSRVRVYTDGQAAESARTFKAKAYTLGQDIVFGKGQYAPRTFEGRRLIAHELTHVVQQQGSLPVVQCYGQGTVNQQPVRQATNQERREFVREAISFLNTGASFYQYMTVDRAGLTRTLTGLKSTVENSQRIVNTYLNGDQTLLGQLQQAYRSAVSSLVRRAASQLNQTTHQVYQTNRSRIHEWGWPQATTDSAAHSLAAALPVQERRRLRVITTSVTISNLHNLFSTQVARTTIPLPRGVTVSHGGSFPVGLQHGLRNVAGSITPSPLVINSTITLALDLERYGGDYSAFRFTYVEHRPRRGPRTREIIIERLGTVGMEGLPASQRQAQIQRFRRFGFTRGRGWSTTQFEALLTAISQVPDNTLTPVRGLTFNRGTVHQSDPNAGGDYNPHTHTITLYDTGLSDSLTRVGTPGRVQGIHTISVHNIVHEIGHAIDLLPLRQTMRNLNQAGATLVSAFRQYETSPGSGDYRFPSNEQARFNRLQGRITQARQAQLQARSRSGASWHLQGGRWEVSDGSRQGGRNNAFRQAARRDGAVFPTNYPNPPDWWQEYFAECFSLYINSPTVLQQQRPNVYTYFTTNFP